MMPDLKWEISVNTFYDEIDYEGKEKALICIPYGGGWSTIFNPWESVMDESVAIVPVMFPGRGPRIEEESYSNLTALIADAAKELSRIKLPLYIYGGCFGGMCGYEIIRTLRDAYGIAVKRFFTNSLYAPEDIDTSEKVSELEDAAFIETIRRKGELPEEVIQDEEVLSFLLGGIRADYALYESYCFNKKTSRVLDTKIGLFVKDKKEIEYEKYRNWSNYSVKEITWNVVECENLFDASSQMEIAKRINQILKEDDSERVKE